VAEVIEAGDRGGAPSRARVAHPQGDALESATPGPKAVERNEAEIARWVAEEWPRIVQTPERAEPDPASSTNPQ
jgi:hypothetical protein